jgi:hypothetical protein
MADRTSYGPTRVPGGRDDMRSVHSRLDSPSVTADIIQLMAPSRLATDTDAEVERVQIAGWRNMSPAQKAATVSGLTSGMFEMARAGVRARFPNTTAREQFLRLAIQTLGADLAVRAYPDAAGLDRTTAEG